MKRSIINELIQWKNSKGRKPLILKGARQVGKTYILNEFGRKEFVNTHYLNFEKDESIKIIFEKDLNPIRIIDELQFKLNTKIDIINDLIIFDEIQQCPRALTSLKYFNEELPQIAICTAGSLIGVTLNIESFPVGKVKLLELFPLTFQEFLLAIGNEKLYKYYDDYSLPSEITEYIHKLIWEYWKDYLIIGGLPEVVKLFIKNKENRFNAFQLVRSLQEDLIEMYIADMAKHSGKTNALHIERIWKNIPEQLAKTVDGSTAKFKFRGIIPGIRGYDRLSSPISWLEKAGLIIRTRIVNNIENPLMAFAKHNFFKLYFFDIGLLCAMSRLNPKKILEYDFGTYKGYIAENFVAQEIYAKGNGTLYCWQGRTSEIEFILETENGILPIEVKAGRVTQSKSLKVFEEKYHPEESIVLSGKNILSNKTRQYYPIFLAGKIDFK